MVTRKKEAANRCRGTHIIYNGVICGDNPPVITIRRYGRHDKPQFEQLYQQIAPHSALPQPSLWTWLMWQDGELIGYTAVTPLPGLPHIYELEGGIRPDKRRQGLGSQLLQRVITAVKQQISQPSQLSYQLTDSTDPVAHFLRRHAFYPEHKEFSLAIDAEQLAAIGPIPPPRPASLAIARFPLASAIAHFRALYDRAFAGHAWHQPFSAEEVEATLDDPRDMLFLVAGETPIGFAWLRLDGEAGEIEPIGIVPDYQGQGNGRYLLLQALQTLRKRGAQQVTISAWADNQPAIHLYQSVGFQRTQTRLYLARDL